LDDGSGHGGSHDQYPVDVAARSRQQKVVKKTTKRISHRLKALGPSPSKPRTVWTAAEVATGRVSVLVESATEQVADVHVETRQTRSPATARPLSQIEIATGLRRGTRKSTRGLASPPPTTDNSASVGARRGGRPKGPWLFPSPDPIIDSYRRLHAQNPSRRPFWTEVARDLGTDARTLLNARRFHGIPDGGVE
jgi:hypothetical protein